MKAHWLNKKNNDKLIVFFAGWSFDPLPFSSFSGDGYDVLFIYDYNDLSLPEELTGLSHYSEKNLVAWSMGVFVAYKFRQIFKDFHSKIAVNGTITPVDDNFGIPVKVFELTLKHAQKGLQEKFYRNIFLNEEGYLKYMLNPVQRTIESRVSELENLYNYVKNEVSASYEPFYTQALVSEFDKIIPPQNQTASHSVHKTPIINLPTGHFPFYYLKSNWNEVLNAN